jgi:preprotein translocase subunit YajC
MFSFILMPGGAPGGSGTTGSGGGIMQMLIMFGAVIVIMYFMMIRPQQKRAKEHKNMLESLKKGDKVVTTSGMHGTITDFDGNSVVIQVAENVKITFDKGAISAKS